VTATDRNPLPPGSLPVPFCTKRTHGLTPSRLSDYSLVKEHYCKRFRPLSSPGRVFPVTWGRGIVQCFSRLSSPVAKFFGRDRRVSKLASSEPQGSGRAAIFGLSRVQPAEEDVFGFNWLHSCDGRLLNCQLRFRHRSDSHQRFGLSYLLDLSDTSCVATGSELFPIIGSASGRSERYAGTFAEFEWGNRFLAERSTATPADPESRTGYEPA